MQNSKVLKTENKSLTILIAEDDDISFTYLEIMLANDKWKIIRTRDGIKTVETVRKNPDINFILMDLKMPVLDGVRATLEIRKFNKEIPIIAQTAYVFESDRYEAMNAGCTDYLPKPIRKKDFLHKMEKYLYRDTAQR